MTQTISNCHRFPKLTAGRTSITRYQLIATLIVWGSFMGGMMDRSALAQPEAHQVGETDSDDASQEPSTAIDKLIANLDSPQWEVRSKSTQRLAKIGVPSIQPLLAKLTGECSLESQTRGIKVLKQIADSNETAAENAAVDALQSIAASNDLRLTRHAQVALRSVADKFNGRTIQEFKALGAEFGVPSRYGGSIATLATYAIKFGEKWRGTPDDLRKFPLLTTVDMIEITGDKFDDEFMIALGKNADPEAIWLDHVVLTDKGFQAMSAFKNLREALIWYTPVSEASLNVISKWDKLRQVQLFGTGLKRDCENKLAEATPGLSIIYKHGALLGVRHEPFRLAANGVRISVTPGSAASRGNIREGDIITSFDGKAIGIFPDLQDAIADKAAGDSVVVGVLTNNGRDEAERTVTLGKWEKD